MEVLRQVTGIIIIIVLCKFLYDLALVVGTKARFYERFTKFLAELKNRKRL